MTEPVKAAAKTRRRLFSQIRKPTVYPDGFVLKGISQRRAGRCYQLAGGALHALGRGARLIHGVIHDPVVTSAHIPHAWIERGNEVWEPVRDQWMTAETFTRLFRPEVGHRYSAKEAAKLLLERRHWGVWDDTPDAKTDAKTGGYRRTLADGKRLKVPAPDTIMDADGRRRT